MKQFQKLSANDEKTNKMHVSIDSENQVQTVSIRIESLLPPEVYSEKNIHEKSSYLKIKDNNKNYIPKNLKNEKNMSSKDEIDKKKENSPAANNLIVEEPNLLLKNLLYFIYTLFSIIY